MLVEAPQRPLFIVGKLSMPLNSFSSPSGTFRCPSISSCHRRERFDAPQFLLPVVGSLLMPLNSFPTKIWNFRYPSLGITFAKLRKNPDNPCELSGFYGLLAKNHPKSPYLLPNHLRFGGGGGGVVTLDGLCCCGLGSLYDINYLFGLGGGGVGILEGDSRC